MNIQNLIICDAKNIFNILIEIKEELNCKLIYKSKQDLLRLENLGDYLILSDYKIKEINNQITITNFPIKINNLIETININFLKKNFNFQSEITIGNYKINLNSRLLIKKNKTLKLTEKETLVISFLKNKIKPSSVLELQKLVWKQSNDLETHTVETHIYRLRKKIKDHFNDDNFIVSLKNGYKVN
tara:strand:- start:2378 stop:2935 length:558 start_codon:yes stop_codon:yes gene_type:complete